jgi:phosphate transport system permease protein
LLTVGGVPDTPVSPMDKCSTLSLHFYLMATETGDATMPNRYASAALLILAILAINVIAYWLMRRFVAKTRA